MPITLQILNLLGITSGVEKSLCIMKSEPFRLLVSARPLPLKDQFPPFSTKRHPYRG